MAAFSYGKRMLQTSLHELELFKKKKRTSPDDEAKYYCTKSVVDKEGFNLKHVSDYKGYGVFCTKNFHAGEFLLQYYGRRISAKEGKNRLRKIGAENKFYFYKFKGEEYCIDAEESHDRICQWVNDAPDKQANAVMKLKIFDDKEFLCLFAIKNLKPGDEVLYNYGDEVNLWWRNEEDEYNYDTDSDPFDMNEVISETSSDDSYISNEENDTPIKKHTHLKRKVTAHEFPFLVKDESSNMSVIVPMVKTVGTTPGEQFSGFTSDTVLNSDRLLVYVNPQEKEDPGDKVPQEIKDPGDKMPQEIEDPGDKVPQGIEDPGDNVLQEIEDPSDKVPQEIEDPGDKVPQEIKDPGDKVPQEIEDPGDKVPQGIEDPGDNVLQEIENPSDKVPQEIEDPGDKVPQEIKDPGDKEDDSSKDEENHCQKLSKQKSKERPVRMCVYCKKTIQGGKLKRHIMKCKMAQKDVTEILKKPIQEQNKFFEKKRIEGIYEHNMNLETLSEEEMMRQRKPKIKDEIRMCDLCRCFLSNRTFYKHKAKCGKYSAPIKKDNIKSLVFHKDEEFVKEILNRFRDGEVGDFIRKDKIVQMIGYKHFCCRRNELSKSKEVRREVMMEMRELTRLFLTFKELKGQASFEDMYQRASLEILIEAINKLSATEETHGEKYGLKVNLNNIFQKSIKTLKRHYSGICEDEKNKELKKFKEAYSDKAPEFLAKARYMTDKNSLKKARMPKNLPDKNDITKVKAFIQAELAHIVENFELKDYSWLRSLVVSRLTLYNARRGEEGCRILIEEWFDAINDVWIPPESIETIEDPAEKFLIGQYKLAYMSGKGKKYVPILIPKDLIEPITILLEKRECFNISKENPFLFATKSSKYPCSGWHAVADVCKAADVSINATRNRHRASTMFASLDMTEMDRKIFYDHMGHEENINKDNYQCPPGLRTVRVMGPFLNNLEGHTIGSSTNGLETESQSLPETVERTYSQEKQISASTDCGASKPSPLTEMAERKVKIRNASFKWSDELTSKVKADFKTWITATNGNRLPRKKDLELYLQKNSMDCSILQLRTKIMNEQNKRRKNMEKKLKKLQGP